MFRYRLRSLGTRSKVASGEARGRRRRQRWVLEGLEHRTLLSGSPTIYTVDLKTDTGTGSDNTGDLLYCITQANANTNTAGSEIEFDPTVFQVATQQSITLSATLDLWETAGPEVLDGPGASDLKITGNDTVQVFTVSSDTTASLSGLTIWGGLTNEDGGGINNQGVLAVNSCTINSNVSSGSAGGGIANDGTLTITNSTFLDNSAGFGGGIENEGALTVTGSQFESNSANFGGGIDNDDGGTAALTSTTLTSNSASSFGGGIFYSGSTPMSVTSSTLTSNTAIAGGGIYNEGDGHDGHNDLMITDSTLSNNEATGTGSSSGGGGVYSRGGTASISGSTLSDNTATQGGGILTSAGALTIMDSTLSGNTLTGDGSGGALYEDGGTLTATNSTIAGNSAGGLGAGIDENAGTLQAVNCTIADNTEPSTGDGFGGGLNVDQGTATLDNTLIALNTDGTGPGAPPDNLYLDGSGTVSSASASNLIGAGGGNSGLTSGVNGNQVGVVDPGLGTLADNGGPTETLALLAGSPAIDAGNNSLAVDPQGNALTTDQRGAGFPRIVNGTVDIGAFERPLVSSGPTVYIVDLTSDTGASTSANDGDILYCVTQANANTNLAGSEIEFSPTVFSTATPQTIELSSTLVLSPRSGPEQIDGPGASIVTVSGNGGVGVVGVFSVGSGVTASLSGLTISRGDIGVDNAGTLTVTNSTIDNNLGGGINNTGSMTITNSTIKNNGEAISGSLGGGINNTDTMTVTDCTVSGNSAGSGGGIDNSGPMTITGSTLSGNTAKVYGGGLDNYAQLTMTGTTVEENSVGANGWGGGIHNESTLTVTGSTIEENSVGNDGYGGGLYNSGSAAIADSTLADNSGANGGGIYVSTGTVTVTNSTINNSVGDGILNTSDGSTTITNSTIAGNTAVGIDDDGGILNAVNCTIADNNGGLKISDGGTAILYNTIVAANTADDVAGTVSSSSASDLIGTGGSGGLTNGSNGNLVGVGQTLLGALADNGGPTQTIALLAGSPAIHAGSVALAVGPGGSPLTTDQRGTGFPREVDGNVDIGAFEVQTVTNNPVPTLSAILPNRIGVGYSSPVTLTVTGSGFVSQSVIDWNSTALATAYLSSSGLSATIPANDFATAGSFPITVVNPTPGGGTSNAATFQVLAAPSIVYVNTTYAADPLGTAVTWTDGSQHFVGYDAFGTVQAGVTAAAPDGTVHIAAGTYTGLVNIAQSLTLAGAGAAVTTIQNPANFFASSDEIAIASGASVTMSGFTVHGVVLNGVGIADEGGTLSATQITVDGFFTSVADQDHAAATITDSTISSNNVGIIVGSSTSDTSTLTANSDNLAGAGAGVWNLQTSGSVDARFNWWGSTSGPTNTTANPGGTGAASAGKVDFSPWLGDANLNPYDYLVFSTIAGDNYIVTPLSGNTGLNIHSGNTAGAIPPYGFSLATLPGGDKLAFAGNGGTITMDGESGTTSNVWWNYAVYDTYIRFDSLDGLNGTTINFMGTGMTRNLHARGTNNSFFISGAGASGPSGDLDGDSDTNIFYIGTGNKLLGNIHGEGSSTLNYTFVTHPLSGNAGGVNVNLGNGTDGTATGVSGSASGITAINGSQFNDFLDAGSVPDVALTGGLGNNELEGTGAGDSVAESLTTGYTLTNNALKGTGGSSFADSLSGIRVANLIGYSSNGNTFNVSGWTGTGSLTAPSDNGTVTASKNANFTLTNTSLQTGDGMSLALSGIRVANLSGTGHDNIMSISLWTGTGMLSDSSGLLGVDTFDSSITLTDSLVTAGPMSLTLSGFITADLSVEADGNPSPGAYTFNVSGWTHQGFLEGYNVVGVTASESADITLTNTSQLAPGFPLLTSGTMSLILSRVPIADLTVTAATGHPSLTINASAFSGTTNLTAAGTVDATLYGGAGGYGTLTATGSGNCVLIGEASDTTLTDTGTGRNILIGGGAGGDTLVGNGNDILVSGTTEYDSDTSADLTALDAILAEWSSSNSYAMRVSKIRRGVRPNHHDAFNGSTIHIDNEANTLSDRRILLLQTENNAVALAHSNLSFPHRPNPIPRSQSNNWFVASRHDHVTRRSNETLTII